MVNVSSEHYVNRGIFDLFKLPVVTYKKRRVTPNMESLFTGGRPPQDALLPRF
jgi:hypothetical protein